MRIYSYRRVSSGRQVEEGDSLDSQFNAITEWAERNGHEIVKDFVDEGVSAFSGNRPQFDLLLEESVANKDHIDGIVVYNFSRFARNQIIRLTAEERLERAGVKLFSVREELPEDDDLAFLLKNIIGTVNEHQSRQNSKTVKDALRETARKGYYTGGVVPFGYKAIDCPELDGNKKRRTLVIEPNEAEVVSKIFELASTGTKGKAFGVINIAKELNNKGMYKKNKAWTSNDVHRILTNTIYYGDLVFQIKENTKVTERIIINVPSIIKKDLFDLIKEKMEARRPSNTESKGIRSKSLLTGILTCKCCGANYRIITGKSGKYEYYKCRNKVIIGTCADSPNFAKKEIEDAILDTLVKEIFNSSRIELIKELVTKVYKELKTKNKGKVTSISKKKQLIDNKIFNLWDQVSESKLKVDEYFENHMNLLKRQHETLEQELNDVKRASELPILKFGRTKTNEFLKHLKAAFFENRDEELIKSYLLAVVDKMEVSRTRIKITGQNEKLISLISKQKMDTKLVPTSVSIWRRERDSNPRKCETNIKSILNNSLNIHQQRFLYQLFVLVS
ncbi:recombinase family protein [Alteromonas sp. BMJM2]|uniref:recombinase family protein n=1 Tax=Alteromonas sp. BMJM2 TaxID=2954241 RepID=UPI0022B4C0CE|nr:recombinase family protein [Alteromonas sp. BMJM2]